MTEKQTRQADWLILEDLRRDPALRPVFDAAVKQVNEGTARVRALHDQSKSIRGFAVDGHQLLGTAVLEYVIGTAQAAEFDDVVARDFTERMRQLFGWNDIDYTLTLWAENHVRKGYFNKEKISPWEDKWTLKPDADTSAIPASFFRFACYIAIANLKHGPSYAHVTANQIFDWVTQLGSKLPAQLKKHGPGELPKDLAEFRAEGLTCHANDALAVIRIGVKDESEAGYAAVLDYLCRLLTSTDFPRSYAIEFRGPSKTYLPIKGLPKKGVNQLFACAVAYPALWPAMERYARAAMRKFEWYTNIEAEDCAMPGTFAVFALAFASTGFMPLVVEYLQLVDGEHQNMQGNFVEAYIDAHGFSAEAVAYLLAVVNNIQHLKHRKSYPALMARRESLQALLQARGTQGEASPISALKANMGGKKVASYAWRQVLQVIWGEAVERDGGCEVIAKAPPELRPLYEAVFA